MKKQEDEPAVPTNPYGTNDPKYTTAHEDLVDRKDRLDRCGS